MATECSVGTGSGDSPSKKRRVGPEINGGADGLRMLLDPVTPDEFFANYWEKKPLVIQRQKPGGYFADLFAMGKFWDILRTNRVSFGKHVNCCVFDGRVKRSLNPPAPSSDEEEDQEGARATVEVVKSLWDDENATVQFFQPQQHCAPLARMMALLERRFGCLVGCNAYMTPAGAQGLAPHHDDIEAFVLQVCHSFSVRLVILHVPLRNMIAGSWPTSHTVVYN